jgi:pimeloyl-ACP methyl ester carboxylesterase
MAGLVAHEYFECFEDFLPQEGIQFIYYDQLGSAYSDQPENPSLWTVERFREELEQVRAALGLDQFSEIPAASQGTGHFEHDRQYRVVRHLH